jgi:hypothetical protein
MKYQENRSFISEYQIKDEVGGACGTHERSAQGFGGEARRKESTRKTEE